jgi:hypothetical protein
MSADSPRPCISGCLYKVTCALVVLTLTVFSSTFAHAKLAVQEQAPQGTVGISYNTVLTVTGGTTPYSFSGSGLPAGLTLNRNTGSITGSPTSSGTFPVTVTVNDAGSNQVQSNFSIIVAKSGTISVNVSPDAGALVSGQTLQFKATVYNSTDQTVTWSSSSGTITSNGLYTAPQVGSGTWTYRVWATSNADSAKSDTVMVVVMPLVVALQISTTSLPEVMAGSAYSETVAATGGKSPYHWKLTSGTLPQGISFANTGVMSGATQQTGSFNLTLQVTDSSWPTQQTATQSYDLLASSLLEITTTLLPEITAGSSYDGPVTGVGGSAPYKWSISQGTLPSGISLGGSTGIFTGSTSKTGQFNFTVKLIDSSTPPQTTTQALEVTVIAAQSTVADFYVAPDGNDSWSGTLSAPNSKNSDGPFATIGRAQTAVQGILKNPKGRTSPIQVMVRAGTYYVSQPVSFTSADSGTSSLGVVWENYPNETPVVSGGLQITQWTHGSGDQWTSTLPSSVQYFEQMFYNGQRRPRPRLGGYLGTYYRVAATIYLPGSGSGPAPDPNCTVYMPGLGWECFDRFQYTKGDPISTSWANLSSPYPQGNIALYDFEKWTVSKLRIKSIDTSSNIVYLTGPTDQQDNYHGFIAGHRYIVENIKDELTQPGQWFLDQSKTPWSLTYLVNSGENPPTDTVIIPQSTQVLVATGLEYVTFAGITFEHDNWTAPSPLGYVSTSQDPGVSAAVGCYNCQHVTMDGVIVTQTSGGGLEFTTTSTTATTAYNTIENSAFYDIGGFGIRNGLLAAYNDTDSNVAQFATVENNVIEGYGRHIASGVGIEQGDGHDNTYTHNDIYDGYHSGIEVCNLGCIPGVSNSRGSFNNTSSFNHVYNIGQGITDDMGGIYYNTYENATGNQVLNNKIHDVNDASTLDADGYAGQGIYLDANTSSTLVENNLVYRTSAVGQAQTCGPQSASTPNTIKNNIFAYGRLGTKQEGCDPPASGVLQFVFTNNLIYYDKGYVQTGYVYCINGPCTEVQKYSDNMYCYVPGTACALPTNPFFTTGSAGRSQSTYYASLSAWQSGTGEDSGSVVKNPGFANPVYPNDDYSLSESPGVGFVVFDPSEAGRSNPVIPAPAIPATWVTAPYNPATDF